MSCSSVGGIGQNPYQFVQPNTAQQTTSDTTTPDSAAAAQLQIQAQQQTAPHQHHHHGGHHGGGAAVSDLLTTIEQALQSADSSQDPNKVIEDAVAKLLSGNGTSDAQNGAPGSASATSQPPDGKSFADFLKAHGVNMQQFRADLLAAVKDAQNGQVNPATALKSLPTGSSVDLTA